MLTSHSSRLKSLVLSRLKTAIANPVLNDVGIVYSKGCGVYGALGNGSLNDLEEFNLFDSNNKFATVSTGWGHSAAISMEKKLFICGRPYDFSNLLKINSIYKFSSYLAKLVANSSNSSYFNNIDNNDQLFGENKLSVYMNPTVVEQLNDIKSVVCSAGLTLALNENGNEDIILLEIFCLGVVYSFGLNRWSQCGVDYTIDPRHQSKNMHVYEPVKVSKLPDNIIQIDAGLQHWLQNYF